VLAFFLGGSVQGCMTWRPQARSAEAIVPEKQPPSVKLELQDGSLMVLTSPAIDGESMTGFGKPGGERVRLNLSQIKTIWIREVDKKRTAVLAGGLVVVGTVAFIYRDQLNLAPGYSAIF
jgi:hypothetical protein